MPRLDDFANLFDYDLWANRLWLGCLASKGWPEPERSVFQHLLAASEIWNLRCQGTSPTAMPQPDLAEDTLLRLNSDWRRNLETRPDDDRIAYRRTTGEPLESGFGSIVRHVFNHGTYHRGELRGLLRAKGDEDFPETDFIRYEMERA